MKRQTLIEYKDASPASQAIYDELISVAGFGVLLNTMTNIVHIPAVAPLNPAT